MSQAVLENLPVERAVLAGICQYGLEVYVELDFIDPDYFSHEINQVIFSCLQDIVNSNQNIEYLTIFSTAQKLGVYELINKTTEMSFIRSLFNFPINKDNVPKFAAKLAKLKLARDIKKALKTSDKSIDKITGDESIEEIIGLAENPIIDITSAAYKEHNTQTMLVGENIDEYVQYLIDNPSDYLGIPTGLNRFDEAVGGGIRRKSICLIGARTGVGKSVISTNVALYVSGKLGIPVLYLDTEMDIGDQRNRMLANISNVKINDIAKGKFANSFMSKESVKRAAQYLKDIPYHYVSIAGQPFDNILNIMKKWIHQYVGVDENGKTKDCLIIYDYFKLMSSAGLSAAMQEYQALGFQITKMNDFCIKYDVPCLSFVQLNREEEIAQSDRLQWLAATVAKFQVKSDEEIADDGDQHGNRKIVLLKTRHGSGLEQGDYINVKMNGPTAKLNEWFTRNELKSGAANNVNTDEESPFEETEVESGEDLFHMQ
jgi:replicative DNA helicase